MKTKIFGGILGLCVADALGVPVEFNSRESLMKNPVTEMRGYGTYNQPPGTWSDDTSMTLCLMDSLTNGLDLGDIMQKFHAWMETGKYTPHGVVFDIGIATHKAIRKYANGTEPLMCGGTSEYDNGNGSVMRILPLVFYLFGSPDMKSKNDIFNCIHEVSALTHAHKRSLVACGIYLSIASELIEAGCDVNKGISRAKKYYSGKAEFADELKHFHRIFDDGFKNLPLESINSSGYVVDTLEAALWCLLNTDDYKSCVLKAVNLGEDTDTVAVVAGGLAGMKYGADSIPDEWLKQIVRLDYVEELCEAFYMSLITEGE